MDGREALLVGVIGWAGRGRRFVSLRLRSPAVLFLPSRDCVGVAVWSVLTASAYERAWREHLGVEGGEVPFRGV